MVTKRRVAMALRAVECYRRQTYPYRSLLIVCDHEDRRALQDRLSRLPQTGIRIVSYHADGYSLGALRNIAVAAAESDLICQWDDDDLYHPDRLIVQVQAIVKHHSSASFLMDQLQLVTSTNSLYWCNWARPRQSLWPCPIPNTVMCRREAAPRYPEVGREAHRSEDLVFMKTLMSRCKSICISGMGHLYIYVTHGSNTWDEAHHVRITRITGLNAAELTERRVHLEASLAEYHLEWPVSVCDFTGRQLFHVHSNSSVAIAGPRGY
jgi:glycosyltransferase involved in cell wall biosynthesis